MNHLKRQLLVYLFALSDLCLLSLALYVAAFGRNTLSSLSILANGSIRVRTIFAVAVLIALWKISFSLMGLYQSRRLETQRSELFVVLKACIVALILLIAVAFVFRLHSVSPRVYLTFLPLAFSLLMASRIVMRRVLKSARLHGRNLRHLVIVGTNVRAIEFANGIVSKPELGYILTGFVDDGWFGPEPGNGIPTKLVSDLSGFAAYLRTHVVDEVALGLPIKSFYSQEDELIRTCHHHGVTVRVISSLFEGAHRPPSATHDGGAPVVSFSAIPNDDIRLAGKRAVDIIGSLSLLIVLSPIMLLAYILVKLDSRGPAIFAQERVGLSKRRFNIYKFRSMVVNAENLQNGLESQNEAEGPVFKIKQDPRITRIGRILRKTSIDELPQLFNVLKGDMSLVGPRPLPVRDYNGFNQDWQRRRFGVRPGITCLWQISGRSAISFDQWMSLDMEYIDTWSLWLDMKILAKTIPAVMRGSGAA
jgi:exopolysaccharide biosynthesis polyprenyl glycosylphosphotransferase